MNESKWAQMSTKEKAGAILSISITSVVAVFFVYWLVQWLLGSDRVYNPSILLASAILSLVAVVAFIVLGKLGLRGIMRNILVIAIVLGLLETCFIMFSYMAVIFSALSGSDTSGVSEVVSHLTSHIA